MISNWLHVTGFNLGWFFNLGKHAHVDSPMLNVGYVNAPDPRFSNQLQVTQGGSHQVIDLAVTLSTEKAVGLQTILMGIGLSRKVPDPTESYYEPFFTIQLQTCTT